MAKRDRDLALCRELGPLTSHVWGWRGSRWKGEGVLGPLSQFSESIVTSNSYRHALLVDILLLHTLPTPLKSHLFKQ